MACALVSGGLAMATSAKRPTPHLAATAAATKRNPTTTTTKHHIHRHRGLDHPHQLLTLNSTVGRRNGGVGTVPGACRAQEGKGGARAVKRGVGGGEQDEDEEGEVARRRGLLQAVLWGTEAVYIVWLLLLPYAPGDPVWAISSATLNEVLNLSLNFFFILPAINSVGIHAMEAPVCHPMAEGLFNFVIGWTFMFAPLLFTDYKRDRFKGSLDLLWGMQMFLTNVILIPYMAIRLNNRELDYSPKGPSQLASLMTRGAAIVGVIGGLACLVSLYWCLFGREDGGYGGLLDRWEFLGSYIGSERLAYAFIWDIALYSIFQPWLIGDNLRNLKENTVRTVYVLSFVPVLGLITFLLSLDDDFEL